MAAANRAMARDSLCCARRVGMFMDNCVVDGESVRGFFILVHRLILIRGKERTKDIDYIDAVGQELFNSTSGMYFLLTYIVV